VLMEWDCRGMGRTKNEAAAIIREILLEKRVPWQDKYGNRRLNLGWAEIDVEPDESTEENAARAIEALNEELEHLGIRLSRFETGRNFTEEEIARVEAGLPHPAEPDPAPTSEETQPLKQLFDEAARFLTAFDPTTNRFTFQTFDDCKERKKER